MEIRGIFVEIRVCNTNNLFFSGGFCVLSAAVLVLAVVLQGCRGSRPCGLHPCRIPLPPLRGKSAVAPRRWGWWACGNRKLRKAAFRLPLGFCVAGSEKMCNFAKSKLHGWSKRLTYMV